MSRLPRRPFVAACLVVAAVLATTACPFRRVVEPSHPAKVNAEALPEEFSDPPPAPPGAPTPPGAAPMPRERAMPRAPDPPLRSAPPAVRIQLVSVVKEGRADVVAEGPWTLQALDGPRSAVPAGGDGRFTGTLRIDGDTVTLGTHRIPRDGAVLSASSLRVDSKHYPGRLRISRTVEGTVRVAVETDLETYLEGVVLGELPPEFPPEGRRVQAIVARTYVLSQPGARVSPDAILVDDTGLTDQEYAGPNAKPELLAAARDAVATTRGLAVVRSNGVPVRAWYHSTCGGRTCDAAAVFRVPEAEGMKGVECGACSTSPRFRWETKIPAEDVLKAAGLSGKLTGFETATSVEGGRASSFRILVGKTVVTVPAADFRLAVGPSKLRSVWIDRATVTGGELVLSGRGWGHGVGLCQWGARERALRGERAETIVLHYYAGTELRRLW